MFHIVLETAGGLVENTRRVIKTQQSTFSNSPICGRHRERVFTSNCTHYWWLRTKSSVISLTQSLWSNWGKGQQRLILDIFRGAEESVLSACLFLQGSRIWRLSTMASVEPESVHLVASVNILLSSKWGHRAGIYLLKRNLGPTRRGCKQMLLVPLCCNVTGTDTQPASKHPSILPSRHPSLLSSWSHLIQL